MSRGFEPSSTSSCFSIRTGTDCGVLFRIMAVFARKGVALSSVHARMIGTGAEAIQAIDIHVEALEPLQRDNLAAALCQIVDVQRVLTAQKLTAKAA